MGKCMMTKLKQVEIVFDEIRVKRVATQADKHVKLVHFTRANIRTPSIFFIVF
jgi:hypothetical protein